MKGELAREGGMSCVLSAHELFLKGREWEWVSKCPEAAARCWMGLHGVVWGCKGLHGAAWGRKGLLGVEGECSGNIGLARECIGLTEGASKEVVHGGLKGVQGSLKEMQGGLKGVHGGLRRGLGGQELRGI